MVTSTNMKLPSESHGKNVLIDGRYLLGKKLGAGNFGEIRLAKDEQTDKQYAVKLEPTNFSNRQLYLENKFYRAIHDGNIEEGIPRVYYYGMAGKYYSLVMDLLGYSIEELYELCNRKFSVKTVCHIAIQTIRRIQTVHSHHIVYRDIKPENFLIGNDAETLTKIYIVDFGLSKHYIDPQSLRHIPYKEHKSLTGTARYMSINTHMGIEQSRRDDLESLGHMFFYLLKGQLPWQGLKANDIKERYQRIGEVKRSTPIDVLCQNCPNEFGTYLKYSRQLDFYQEPEYDYLVGLFEKLLNNLNEKGGSDYDWLKNRNFKFRSCSDSQFPRPSTANTPTNHRPYTPNNSKFVEQVGAHSGGDLDKHHHNTTTDRKVKPANQRQRTATTTTAATTTKPKTAKKKSFSLNCCN